MAALNIQPLRHRVVRQAYGSLIEQSGLGPASMALESMAMGDNAPASLPVLDDQVVPRRDVAVTSGAQAEPVPTGEGKR